MDLNKYFDNAYSIQYDLTRCENEPIHQIRLVQSFVSLLVCDAESLQIIQASENVAERFGIEFSAILGGALKDILEKNALERIKVGLESDGDFNFINPIPTIIQQQSFHLIAHINPEGLLIIEIEPASNAMTDVNKQFQLNRSVQRVQTATIENLFEVTAQEVKKITGYDRVMIYRFDEEYNGTVIAEAKEEQLEPFLGLHYPASDIPSQARALFLKNKVRVICDIHAMPSLIRPSLHPETNLPLDLTYSVARASSPIHIEYLRNMEVGATLTIAIVSVTDNRLWGLIACHHRTALHTDYLTRSTCALLGQIFSGHLTLQLANQYRESVIQSNIVRAKLFEQMSEAADINEGLTQGETNIMDLVESDGACLLISDQTMPIGNTPSLAQINEIKKWLEEHMTSTVFASHQLPVEFPAAANFKDKAAGLLVIRIAQNPNEYIMWFRAEQSTEVRWGGNPNKSVMIKEGQTRLSPRKSFAQWKEKVDGLAQPWTQSEFAVVTALHNDIKEYILKRFSELERMNDKLKTAYLELESFSYSVSHDLRAPLRSIDGFTQILLEDYGENLDEYGTEVLDTIVSSTVRMNNLINDILEFSRLGRSSIILNQLNVLPIIQQILAELKMNPDYQRAKITIHNDLPQVWADQSLFRQLLENIISNALKYSKLENQPTVIISGSEDEQFSYFSITDNGVGFSMEYADKIFGVFQRLVNNKSFEGTGVGLAIVSRIIERHQGNISVNSKIGEGATFSFSLPKHDDSKN
ncbi:MAG: ATP-binding protein [Saprospiraceae bacterium]